MTKVELFEIIRNEHFLQDKSIREIARRHKIHRRQVRQALTNAVPPVRKTTKRSCLVLTDAIKFIINKWLEEDLAAPRKQRHTGERIFKRLVAEHDFKGALVTVQHYVYKYRKTTGANTKVFIPQVYNPGDEAEVDWYEAMVDFPEGRRKIYFFQMRSCYSGNEFHMAFERQNQQSFLAAHVAAFHYFGGVFKTIKYDNLTSAVKKVLRGRKRIETEKFITLRSHYLFQSFFCLPGVQGAHEKGGVEGGVGRFRRAHLVPVPNFKSLEQLNKYLLECCANDTKRTISGKSEPVLQRWQAEIPSLLPLPKNVFATHEVVNPTVNSKSLVRIKNNYYSVPVAYVGQAVEAQVACHKLTIFKNGKQIAMHNRSYLQQQTIAELEHYLPLLKHKPGALPGSAALAQARNSNQWPVIYDRYWQALRDKYGTSDSNAMIIDFLIWIKNIKTDQIEPALHQAICCGSLQLDAIAMLIRRANCQELSNDTLNTTELGDLLQYEYTAGTISHYDNLLTAAGGSV